MPSGKPNPYRVDSESERDAIIRGNIGRILAQGGTLDTIETVYPGAVERLQLCRACGRDRKPGRLTCGAAACLLSLQRRPKDPEHVARQSESLRRRWQDPTFRTRMLPILEQTRGRRSPDASVRQAASLKRRWQDPEYRAKILLVLERNRQRRAHAATR